MGTSSEQHPCLTLATGVRRAIPCAHCHNSTRVPVGHRFFGQTCHNSTRVPVAAASLVDVAMPTLPLPRIVCASRHSHSPRGGLSTCTVSSVLMKFHRPGSSSADTPEAESTHDISRCTGLI